MEPSDLQRQVDPSHADFTVGFLLDQLNIFHPHLMVGPVKRAEAEKLSTGGYISDIYRFRIEFAKANEKTFSCIFKVPTAQRLRTELNFNEETRKKMVEWCYYVHNAECHFYADAVPTLHNAPLPLPFRLPQLYAFRPCPSKDNVSGGFLLMEDLSADDQNKIAQVELVDGLNKEQVESAISSLAQFHATCLWLPPALVDSFRLKHDLSLTDYREDMFRRLLAMPDAKAVFGPWERELLALYKRSGTTYPDEHKQFGLAPVITHGDFWCNNFFFQQADDGSAANKLDSIFDWQVVHSGTGVNDLLCLMYVCVDPSLRRAHAMKWLCLYADQLNAALDQILAKDYKDDDGIKNGNEEQRRRRRSRETVRKLALFHSEYELCFQLFLMTTVLGGEKESARRQQLLQRMLALFMDCCVDVKKEGGTRFLPVKMRMGRNE